MKKKNILFASVFIAIFFALLLFSYKDNFKEYLLNDNLEILDEIDRLLLPVYSQNITEADFNNLKEMVKRDKYASHEVSEMIMLAKYKEYSHIGHGLGFVYEHVQTGETPICPGHLLAHYYVFLKHGENDLALENLEHAESDVGELKTKMDEKNEFDYSPDFDLMIFHLSKIKNGDNTISEEKIETLSEIICG